MNIDRNKAFIAKELLEWLRTRRLFVLFAVLIFVAISSPLIADVMPQLIATLSTGSVTISIPDPTWKDALDQYMKNYSQFVLVVVMIVGITLFSEEKAKRTLELLVVRPISRSAVVIIKFGVALGIASMGSLVSILMFRSYTAHLFEPISLGASMWLWLLLTVQIGVIISLALSSSLLFSSSFTAFGVLFVVYVIVTSLLGLFERFQAYLPSYVLQHYQELFANSATFGDFLPSTMVSICVGAVALLSAVFWFKQYE